MKREKIYHYTYQIDNLINGKYYRGKHSAKSLNNDYMGSGKLIIKAIDKWAKNNIERVREIHREASRRYRAKKKAAKLAPQQPPVVNE